MTDSHDRDDNRFEEVERRLERLRPDDPSPETLGRIRRSIDAEIDAAALEPEIASQLEQLDAGEPAQETLDRIWERVDEETGTGDTAEPAPVIAFPVWRWTAAAAAVIVLLLVGPLRVAADDALPGSPLYPVKRAYEQVRLGVAVTPAQRTDVALSLTDRRRSEAEQLVARGGSPDQVEHLTAQGLSYLSNYTAGTEAAEAQVQLWERTIASWPDAYGAQAGAALASWRNTNPDIAGSAVPSPTPTATLSPTETPALVPALDPSATATRTPTSTATRTVVPTQTQRPTAETTLTATGALPATPVQPDVTATLPQVLPSATLTVPSVLPSTTPTVASVLPSATATPAPSSTVAPTESPRSNASTTPAPAPPTATLPPVLPSETPTLPPILPSESPTLPALLPSVTPTLDALP